MNQDISSQITQSLGHSDDKVNIDNFKEFSKSSCKNCLGRGFNKIVKNVNSEWVFDHYEICKCVLKSKRISELISRVNQQSIKDNNYSDKSQLESCESE